jgi:hypothetical protein
MNLYLEVLGFKTENVPANGRHTFHLGPFPAQPDFLRVQPSTPDDPNLHEGEVEWDAPMIQGKVTEDQNGDHTRYAYSVVLTVTNLRGANADCTVTALRIGP